MKFIGITGGVGAGKTDILNFLSRKPKVRILLADEIAHEVMNPGTECYKKILDTFWDEDILDDDGFFHRGKFAQVIFSDAQKRMQINSIVHPAVKAQVRNILQQERECGSLEYLFFEAALLLEEHYDEICDEIWYIYTSEETRRDRLRRSRGYSDEKIMRIFESQLKDSEFRNVAHVIIDNNGTKEETYLQIEEALRR